MNKLNNKKFNLRRGIYRGIIAEIAREQEVSNQAIWQSLQIYQNPRIITIFHEKLKQRRITLRRVEKIMEAAQC